MLLDASKCGLNGEFKNLIDFRLVWFKDLPCSKTALTRSIFELEKCIIFFKWARIFPETDW